MNSSDIVASVAPDLANRSASIDPLTGLAGAASLGDWLRSVESPLALVLFDLKGLRAINRRHGYATGDHLLRVAASRLRKVAGGSQRLLRLDGGLFAVTVDAGDLQRVPRFVEEAFHALAAPLRGRWSTLAISASVGVALRPWHGDTAADLLAHAREALDEAKRAGSGACRLYDARAAIPKVSPALDSEFARALRLGEWELHYQPQVAWPSGRLDGVEALLRWRHPDRGLLLPKDFLADLAVDRTVGEVARWVIAQACQDLARWRRGTSVVPRVAVNLFAGASEGLTKIVVEALAANGLEPSDLELEVIETVVLDSGSVLFEELRSLRAIGVDIALDDFGTGFASLSTLRDLPVTCLKIDRSFVCDLRRGSADHAVVAALLTLGRELDLRVVAEGVERRSQAERLSGMGCEIFQGFFFAKAMPAAELERWAGGDRTTAVARKCNHEDVTASTHDRLWSLEAEC